MEAPPSRGSSWWPPGGQVADGMVAVLLLSLVLVELVTSDHVEAGPVAVSAAGIAAVAYAWRRLAPLAAVVVVYAAMVVADVLGSPIEELAASTPLLLLTVYSAALYGRGWRPFAALTVALAGVTVSIAVVDSNLDDLLYAGPLVVGGWVAGWLVRLRLHQVAVLASDAARLEHERERAALEATAQERTRIARELHDVLAHSVSVMVVQAAAADRSLLTDTERAQQALDAVQDEGRRALADLARLLGLMREEHSEIGLVPQPTAADVQDLVARTAQAGLPVELSVEGEPASLPPGLGLTVFRIVQEALTNVRRHAGAVSTYVHLRCGSSQVTVEVTNDGGVGTDSPEGSVPGGGRGLVGMRERVRSCGGTLVAGPRPGGGYTVTATLPLDGQS